MGFFSIWPVKCGKLTKADSGELIKSHVMWNSFDNKSSLSLLWIICQFPNRLLQPVSKKHEKIPLCVLNILERRSATVCLIIYWKSTFPFQCTQGRAHRIHNMTMGFLRIFRRERENWRNVWGKFSERICFLPLFCGGGCWVIL